ncbi:Anti-sigma regulatory factor (Ser/Thr protein kinase) [Fodinibius roseus]|uniref:Anti-sigma regulatory factor (Ser/Thr protein kinase) n=1 Tax=Fodinibius roseus TaxID=1194090 RepID=A0A1M4X7J1_9BACT|nr:GNAT family N-acetyltransferase [Fodinibius roseus]SHE89454.1 Anti-sigma regulatory factor (Ser/Thr protein kinase) [Fodinibius roseus]
MDARFQISTDEQIINPVCDFTYSWGVNCGLSKGDALRFSVAVSELITDVILFAFPDDSKQNFEIEFHHTFSNVEIIVSELGEPFDPDRHTYDVQKVRCEDDFEGAGLLLMQSFSDEFSFINKGKEGKEFRLAKNIQIHDIDELLLQSAEQREAQVRSEEDEDTHIKIEDFTVERIKPADAEEISKLFYRTYGYTYNKEDLYLPKKIEESVLAKEKLGVIARNKDGKAIGFFSVIPNDNSNLAEVAEAVVSPRYRRNGVMSAMMEQLIEIARSRQTTTLVGMAVTNHPVSQKVNNKFGYKTTALQLAFSKNVKYKGFDEEYSQPVSMVLDFLPIIHLPKKAVYLPKRYNEIILETYNELGMDVEPKGSEPYHLADKSDIDLRINYSSSSSLIIVKKYGQDFFTTLSGILGSLEEKSPKTILLDLPLENRATPEQFSNITMSLNFLYCGLLPQYHFNADFLRVQKVYSAIDFNIIDIYSEFGKKIKSFIADEYHRCSEKRQKA